jgi:hypothetical protein
MNSVTDQKAFTQTWLQSLTLVARNPVAQGIKPLLDTINDLCRIHSDSDRMTSAQKLWDFASREGLQGLLSIVPVQQPDWTFDRESPFVFQRTTRDAIDDFAAWTRCLGIQPNEVGLVAEVSSRDWLSLVRQEAVRLQHAMNTASMPAGLNQRLPCTGAWDLSGWSIRFTQAEWVVVRFDEPCTVQRPALEEIEETLAWAVAAAHDAMVPKTLPTIKYEAAAQPWMSCVKRLEPLHQRLLLKEAKDYSPWFRRVWACVWTVVYREQNVLRGEANLDVIRQELADCINHVPRLTIWMFAFAKLVCECQLGRGLGISGDYAV